MNRNSTSPRVAALHTKLPEIIRGDSSKDTAAAFNIAYPPYVPIEMQPAFGQDDFRVQAHCLARVPGVQEYDTPGKQDYVYFFEVRIQTTPFETLLISG